MKNLIEQYGKRLDMVNENLEALKAIFPEAFTEDGVRNTGLFRRSVFEGGRGTL